MCAADRHGDGVWTVGVGRSLTMLSVPRNCENWAWREEDSRRAEGP